MARQPETVESLEMDTSGLSRDAASVNEDPEVGDIYRSRGGQPAYWWVVSIVRGEFHHTAIALVFNTRGEVTGCSKWSVSYLAERQKIGRAIVPRIEPEWFF